MSQSVMFVRGNLENVVWDSTQNKPLAIFIDGLFDTSDKDVIATLSEMGYKTIEDYGGNPPSDGFSDPDRGPVVDVTTQDVRAAKSEVQELAKSQRQQMQKRLAARIGKSGQNDPDDDIEYVPKKKSSKKKPSKKKSSKKKS